MSTTLPSAKNRIEPDAALPAIGTVLLDLDGTLADTAPDMALALDLLMRQHGLAPLPFAEVRPWISLGANALVRLGFGSELAEAELMSLRQRYLEIYNDNLCRSTVLFPGMARVLAVLEASEITWGVVTNKPGWLTNPLLEWLDLSARAACVVSGDTLPLRKPDPAPIHHACEQARGAPATTLMIGDAPGDIEAGLRAGTRTLAVRYGYLGAEKEPEHWGADGVVDEPVQILDWLLERTATVLRASAP